LGTSIEIRRNLRGIRFPSCCSREERRQVERAATKALASLDVELQGSYFPLRSSQSFPPKAGGMTNHQEDKLREAGMLFVEPDSKMRLAAGLGQQWPDARGVFVSETEGFYAWINEEDHMRFFMRQTSDDLKQLWTQINRALSIVQDGLEADNHAFSHTSSLGYVTTCPSKLGTGMKVTVALSLPHLGNSPNFPALCNALRLVSTREYGSVLGRDIWTITNVDCLGVSEVDIVSGIIQGCARLVALETRSERGESIFDAIPGLGKEPFPGFSLDKCPPRLPDLTYHKTLVADVLRTHPDVYRKLRRTSTRMGVQLAPCIKPGIDTKGSSEHPVSGLVAGMLSRLRLSRRYFTL